MFRRGRIVTLSVEEAGEPVGSGGAMSDPVVNEGTAQNQVVDPATQRLEGRVGGVGPQPGHLVKKNGRWSKRPVSTLIEHFVWS